MLELSEMDAMAHLAATPTLCQPFTFITSVYERTLYVSTLNTRHLPYTKPPSYLVPILDLHTDTHEKGCPKMCRNFHVKLPYANPNLVVPTLNLL